MLKTVLASFIILTITLPAFGQQPASKQAATEKGFIDPANLNVNITPDERTIIVMAAINMAGFDVEPSGEKLSPAREELRRDLASLDPRLKEKLTAYYKSHRRPNVDEISDAARYAALSMLMTPPPGFSIYERGENIAPPDLRALFDFQPLIQEFYIKSNIKALVPKYKAVAAEYAVRYRQPVGQVVYETLNYFHAQPETVIHMKPLVVEKADKSGRNKTPQQSVVARTRARNVYIIPDPLAALDTSVVRGDILNQKEEFLLRRVGDDYIVIVGPSRTPNIFGIRQALIRFIIDPIVERRLRAALEFKDPILNLVNTVPTASAQFRASVYLVLRESLAEAAEARMRRLNGAGPLGAYGDDDAVFDLSQAYLKGAVLSFHFYEALKGLEQVGINIEDIFDQTVATTKFEREAQRPKEFEPVVARVAASRKAGPAPPVSAEPAAGSIAGKILLSDDLIRQRKFGEARVVLEEIVAAHPDNARAVYGLAQVVNQTPSKIELDPNADENDKIQAQHDRLEEALNLYNKAIGLASKENERWLIQWSHVLIGRILDFQEFRADAIAHYEKAIALGDVPNGALREALEGKQRPYGQK